MTTTVKALQQRVEALEARIERLEASAPKPKPVISFARDGETIQGEVDGVHYKWGPGHPAPWTSVGSQGAGPVQARLLKLQQSEHFQTNAPAELQAALADRLSTTERTEAFYG